MLILRSLEKEDGIAFFESVRGRGDGFSASAILAQPTVAPHAGARIETKKAAWSSGCGLSPPTRGRGLKPSQGKACRTRCHAVRKVPPTLRGN